MSDPSAKPLQEHVLIISDDGGHREFLLTETFYTVGRSPRADIRIKSQFVSRIHAVLVRKSSDDTQAPYRIIDGDEDGQSSVNGLLVNGKKQQDYTIQTGDEIIMGPQVSLRYEYRRRDQFGTIPGNEQFDITLIDPSMIEDEEEIPTSVSPSPPE
ncbi:MULTISPECIES: FHA domain-containing protein [unclassified Synechocystis]|uniref:FHA domain-containing protein n=1 Tax=unclassified Synechocystis TaxID=2640012 RepID=UPI00048DA406|nr:MULTISPECIES: FHA domain-containing protein [unclassified Synechocystis]MCT0253725.1 FHA domain-containing protein [Synechocystis sp. CS-94]